MLSRIYSLTQTSANLLAVSCLLLTSSCNTHSRAEWAASHHFDAEAWRSDKQGCNGKRESLSGTFEQIRTQLRGFSEEEILDLLGKPDGQLLRDRHQKYYLYYLQKGPQCADKQGSPNARSVAIRFNSLGYATEVTLQQGTPQ